MDCIKGKMGLQATPFGGRTLHYARPQTTGSVGPQCRAPQRRPHARNLHTPKPKP